MIVAVVVLGVVILALLYLRDSDGRSWTKERQLLLERIQHPERVSIQEPRPVLEPLQTDGAEMALVGTIQEGAPDDAH